MHPLLTMTAREIRRQNRDRRVVLWGSTHWRQFGSPEDLALAKLEAERWAQMRRSMVAFARAARSITRSFEEIARELAIAGEKLGRAFGALAVPSDGDASIPRKPGRASGP
jgi:hypothetical protein